MRNISKRNPKSARNTISNNQTHFKHKSCISNNNNINKRSLHNNNSCVNLFPLPKKPPLIINILSNNVTSLKINKFIKLQIDTLHNEINNLQTSLNKQRKLTCKKSIENNRLISENKILKISINIYKKQLRFLQRELELTQYMHSVNANYVSPNQNDYVDIDNMTYEQLLELEEQIGYVNKGLSREEMQNIIKTKCVDNKLPQEQCIICQEGFNINEYVTELKCKHCFHYECIIKWLEQNKQCPNCKCEV